jgi:Divergent InlB B-repeat domain
MTGQAAQGARAHAEPRRARSSLRRLTVLLAFTSASASPLTAPPAASAAPLSTSPPVISGTLEAGQALTASTGTWADASPIVSYAYQWLRCDQDECTNIDYATANPYTLPWSFAGYQAEVTVTATDADGALAVATSTMTDVINPGPTFTLGESAVGAGSVTGFEAGPEAAGRTADTNLSCPGACGALYPYLPGTEVELIATPAPGSAFLGWGGGACSGSAPTCSLTMSASDEVTATFSGQAISTPVLPLRYETEAGEPPPPSAGAPSMGAWEPPAPSAAGLPARLLGIRYRRHHAQAVVRCEEMRPCRLSLAIFAATSNSQAMIARRSFDVPAQRSARISLALDRAGERILARRRRLPVTARLMLSAAGRASLVEQVRLTLAA